MTREEFVRLIRKAGLVQIVKKHNDGTVTVEIPDMPKLEYFAELMIEECAKVCEKIEMNSYALWDRTADPEAQGRGIGAADCAAAIRELK